MLKQRLQSPQQKPVTENKTQHSSVVVGEADWAGIDPWHHMWHVRKGHNLNLQKRTTAQIKDSLVTMTFNLLKILTKGVRIWHGGFVVHIIQLPLL